MDILIDADTLCYRACLGAETEIEWSDDVWSLTSDRKDVIRNFESLLERILDEGAYKRVLMFLTGGSNFRRDDVWPQYKGNRGGGRKPLGIKWLRDVYIPEHYETFKEPRLEADDVLGIAATTKKHLWQSAIWSEDKDLLTVPGLHLIDGELREIDQDAANTYFYTQVLTGDSVDGYPGCPGIGPVRAKRILDPLIGDHEATWTAIVEAYEKNGKDADFAVTMARLAYILNDGDYDWKTKEVHLWKPPLIP